MLFLPSCSGCNDLGLLIISEFFLFLFKGPSSLSVRPCLTNKKS